MLEIIVALVMWVWITSRPRIADPEIIRAADRLLTQLALRGDHMRYPAEYAALARLIERHDRDWRIAR